MNYLKEVESVLRNKNIAMFPCSQSEILKIEQFYEVKLPASYVNFLSIMGKGAGMHLLGSDIFYDSIFDLREWSQEFISEHKIEDFPENAFIFGMHQGYQIVYFINDGTPNPEIVRLSETENEGELARRTFKSLNDFLLEGLR